MLTFRQNFRDGNSREQSELLLEFVLVPGFASLCVYSSILVLDLGLEALVGSLGRLFGFDFEIAHPNVLVCYNKIIILNSGRIAKSIVG